MFDKYYIVTLAILSLVGEICVLIEQPKREENDIISTDTIIRSTANKLFGCLKLRPNKDRSLKQYAKVHNYLASITLQDYSNLKQISSLSKSDKIDNKTRYFIANINYILNKEIARVDLKNNIKNATDNDDTNILLHISRFLDEGDRLKEFYSVDEESIDSNLEKLQNASRKIPHNITVDDYVVELDENDNSTVNGSEYWVPEPKRENDTRRVFKGKKVKIKKFPFVASVQLFNKFHCAGSIIKSDLVITAASCLQLAHNNRFFRENPNYISVRVGSTHYNVGGEKIEVIAVYFHPGYTPSTLKANLCLLRLHRHIIFTKKIKRVKKIDFDRKAHQVPFNLPGITIIGWGARGPGNIQFNPWQDSLAHAILPVYSIRDCKDVYSKLYVTNTNFCAGFVSHGGGACNHDVGAPGIFGAKLIGVVSFGSPVCGAPDSPTVFTKLGFYTDWIEEIMEMPVPMGRQYTTKYKFPQFTSPFTHVDPEARTYFVTPIDEVDEHTFDDFKLPETSKLPKSTDPEKAQMLREKSLFNDFLKTMFTSNEVVQYQNMFDEELSRLQAKKNAILAGRQAGGNEGMGIAGPTDWSEEVKVKPVTQPLSSHHKHTTKDFIDSSDKSSNKVTKKHKNKNKIRHKKHESHKNHKYNDDDVHENDDFSTNDLFLDLERDGLGADDPHDHDDELNIKDKEGNYVNNIINAFGRIDGDAVSGKKKKHTDSNDMIYDIIPKDTTLHPEEKFTPHDYKDNIFNAGSDQDKSPKKHDENLEQKKYTKHNIEPNLNNDKMPEIEEDDEYGVENIVNADDEIVNAGSDQDESPKKHKKHDENFEEKKYTKHDIEPNLNSNDKRLKIEEDDEYGAENIVNADGEIVNAGFDQDESLKKHNENFEQIKYTKHNIEPNLNSNDKRLEIEEDDEYGAENIVNADDEIVTNNKHVRAKDDNVVTELYVGGEVKITEKHSTYRSRNIAVETDPDYYSLLEPSNKDLEKEIVNLIDDIDLKRIIKDSSRELHREPIRNLDLLLTTTPMTSARTSHAVNIFKNLEKLDKEYNEKNAKIDEATLNLLSDKDKGEDILDDSGMSISTDLTLKNIRLGSNKSDLFEMLRIFFED